jgi:hypothetical protein
MKRIFFRTFVVSLGAALLALAAFADSDLLYVNIPYSFVANGKTLPAGNYAVRRLSDSTEFSLEITSRLNGQTVYVLSNEVARGNEANPSVTFLVSGDQHFLTTIKTENRVFSFPVSPAAVQAAANAHAYLSNTVIKDRN